VKGDLERERGREGERERGRVKADIANVQPT